MTNKITDTSAAAPRLSQYQIDPKVAAACVAKVRALYADLNFETNIDPSAGQGAFSGQLRSDCIALDLAPTHPGIETADYLDWKPAAPTGRCLVIGTPPFAKGAALAYLNHAAEFADVVAFVLPTTFRKTSYQNRVDPNMHLVHEEEIPSRAFTKSGTGIDVPCVFQIWERQAEPRAAHVLKRSHPHFERCTQAEADLVIRRVGACAGALKPLDTPWSAESNIFLRAVGCSREDLRTRFETLKMASAAASGAGGDSINMAEIVELYETAIVAETAAACAEADAPGEVPARQGLDATARVIPFPGHSRRPEREQGNDTGTFRGATVLGIDAGLTSGPGSIETASPSLTQEKENQINAYDEFLEDFGFDVEQLEELVRYDPIWQVWEQFGSYQDIGASARPGEHGVFEISHGDEHYAISFLLPFDERGALSGPGRIALENRHSVIDSRELDMDVSWEIWAEVAGDIQDALPNLTGKTDISDDECLSDHRFWVAKQAEGPAPEA
ncbi:hypothetical protein [Marinovum sp.]|uniref:hypothetical protein n=1 Tax=Marinovum sp. TaxID=2024839 RepID=UPI003A90DC00